MAKTQELIYNSPVMNMSGLNNRASVDIPLIKDIVAFAFHNDLQPEAITGDSQFFYENADNGLVVRIYADSETIFMPAVLIRLVMARFYKLLPYAVAVADTETGDWFFIIPVNISPEDFKVVKVEIDMTYLPMAANALDLNAWTVATIYGDAVKGTFLNYSRDVYDYGAAGSHYFSPPIAVELIDIYMWNYDDKTSNLITNVVFRAGTERIYDTTKYILKVLTAVDTQNYTFIGYPQDVVDYGSTAGNTGLYDEIIITISPTLVGDSTMSLQVDVSADTELHVHWLIRKNVRG